MGNKYLIVFKYVLSEEVTSVQRPKRNEGGDLYEYLRKEYSKGGTIKV